MKIATTILTAAAAAFMLTSGAALAAPGKGSGHSYGKPGYSKQVKQVRHRGVSPGQRVAIARSARNLAALKRRAWRDGRLSMRERIQIRNAERRHAALVRRSHRR